jgi:translation initiation factor 2B subunit (eIF-2B alpha/beta/delta family)
MAIIICSYFIIRTLKIYQQVSSGNFQIKCVSENAVKGYNVETHIYADGSFIKKISYDNNELNKSEKGYYSKKSIANFIMYAIRHNLLSMNNNTNSSDILDKVDIFFEIRIGEKEIQAGRHIPQGISDDFGKICEQFNKLDYEVTAN